MKVTYTIAYKGGHRNFDLLRANVRIWYSHMAVEEKPTPHYLNAFGIAKQLNPSTSNPIVVEINIALEGAHRWVASIFALDTFNKKYASLTRKEAYEKELNTSVTTLREGVVESSGTPWRFGSERGGGFHRNRVAKSAEYARQGRRTKNLPLSGKRGA